MALFAPSLPLSLHVASHLLRQTTSPYKTGARSDIATSFFYYKFDISNAPLPSR